jgi:cysteine desulfurase / selenocysteine lyase
MDEIRNNFPIYAHHPALSYLDTASTAQVPQQVVDAMATYYTTHCSNVHRGLYPIAAVTDQKVGEARSAVADFIGAAQEEIVFTSGSTDALNMLASALAGTLSKGDTIVLTRYEHHANLLPWQQLSQKVGAQIEYIDEANIEKAITERTKIVSVSSVSNALGIQTPLAAIRDRAKEVGAVFIVDHAQGVVHGPTDVRLIGCDFLVFSGHKLYGPTGVGALFGTHEWLERLEPVRFGGGMVSRASYEEATWAPTPSKFEPGTPPIAAIIGLHAAIEFVTSIGWDAIQSRERLVRTQLLECLNQMEGVNVLGPTDPDVNAGVVSFTLDSVHPHDIADILGYQNVAVRAGHHCAMPLMTHLGVSGTVRASIGLYNTRADIIAFEKALHTVKEKFE